MLFAVSLALALDAIEEGPWQIFECVEGPTGLCTAGPLLGEGFATDPAGTNTWHEYAERSGNWGWANQKTWWVTVPASGTLSCPTCQDVSMSTPDAFRPKPSYTTPPGNAVALNEWHAPGRYEITAVSSSGTSKKAWYYVTAPDANGVLTERICAETGFKWPAKAAGSNPSVTWKIKWESDASLAACPTSGRKTRTDFTVDLSP